jgi:hypothetical protein
MTIRMFKAVLAGSAMLALGLSANAAQAATATANAKAQILKAITFTKNTDVDFGTIVSGAAAATVGLSSAGVITCGTGLVCAGTPAVGQFAITGTTGQVVLISTTGASLTGTGLPMPATLSTSVNSLTLTGVATTDVFKVSGTLSVGAAQVEGVYAGAFTVTANYQ